MGSAGGELLLKGALPIHLKIKQGIHRLGTRPVQGGSSCREGALLPRLLLQCKQDIHPQLSGGLVSEYSEMLVVPFACLAFLVLPTNSAPLHVPATHLKNGDTTHMVEDTEQQKLNAPPHECRAPPCTPSRILHRAKRTIDLFPFSLLKVSLLGARLQIFPDAPLGANNFPLFDFELKVPKELAFLVPGQG